MDHKGSFLLIADRHTDFAQQIALELRKEAIRVEVNDRPGTLQSKIREATLQRTPFMGIIGDKEIEQHSISVRKRGGEDLGQVRIETIIKQLQENIDKKI